MTWALAQEQSTCFSEEDPAVHILLVAWELASTQGGDHSRTLPRQKGHRSAVSMGIPFTAWEGNRFVSVCVFGICNSYFVECLVMYFAHFSARGLPSAIHELHLEHRLLFTDVPLCRVHWCSLRQRPQACHWAQHIVGAHGGCMGRAEGSVYSLMSPEHESNCAKHTTSPLLFRLQTPF